MVNLDHFVTIGYFNSLSRFNQFNHINFDTRGFLEVTVRRIQFCLPHGTKPLLTFTERTNDNGNY